MEPTTRFRQSLPHVLLPVSQPLSALHSARGRLHSPSCPTDPNICSACGTHLHTGTSQSRLARRSRSKKARVLQTTCLLCDHAQTVPLELYSSAKPPALHIPPAEPYVGPNIPSRAGSIQPPKTLPTAHKDGPRDNGEHSATSASLPQTNRSGAAASKMARPKKKTGLHAMLARNREQEEKRAKNQADQGGLSAFLNGL